MSRSPSRERKSKDQVKQTSTSKETYKYQHFHLPLGTDFEVVTNESGTIIKFPLAAAATKKPTAANENDDECWQRIKSRVWFQSSHDIKEDDIVDLCLRYGYNVGISIQISSNIVLVEFASNRYARSAVEQFHRQKFGDRKLHVSH
jgi:hypothetical protein